MTQRWISHDLCSQKTHILVTKKQTGHYPLKSREMQDGGRDQMLWHWAKGGGGLGILSHKHQWWCSSLKKNVWESCRLRRWEVFREKEILRACAQAQRGRRARLTQGTAGSWHSWSLACIFGQVLRVGIAGEEWSAVSSEGFTGNVMRGLVTTWIRCS